MNQLDTTMDDIVIKKLPGCVPETKVIVTLVYREDVKFLRTICLLDSQ